MENRTTYGTYLDWLREKRDDKPLPSNPYLHEAAELKTHIFTSKELRELNGVLFNNNKSVVIEIGCYLGATLIELAENNKETNFIGIDIKYKRVVKSSRKIINRDLDNCLTVIADAKDFFSIVPDNSIEGVTVFYPDPWIKEAKRKRRLINSKFLELLKEKLVPGGFIWFKTDNQDYYDDLSVLIKELGFKSESHNTVLPSLPGHETFFEQMFRELGVSKKELIFYS